MVGQHFSGGCHCGAVRFEVEADLAGAIACNCSRCQKLGAILTFAPAASFRLVAGEDSLTDYRFNQKVIHHLFCRTCGIQPFARGNHPKDGSAMVAVNVRCLDGVEPDTIEAHKVDGRNA
jgi:hypothetical protein